jgi:hypothetical protein
MSGHHRENGEAYGNQHAKRQRVALTLETVVYRFLAGSQLQRIIALAVPSLHHAAWLGESDDGDLN